MNQNTLKNSNLIILPLNVVNFESYSEEGNIGVNNDRYFWYWHITKHISYITLFLECQLRQAIPDKYRLHSKSIATRTALITIIN